MIDFRYHIVSLVSVFLALAVGIVLGAGPLQTPIGNTLTGQVDSLRQDRDTMRKQLDSAHIDIKNRNNYITSLTDDILPGTLSDVKVAVVALPYSSKEDVDLAVANLTKAGASISGQVKILDEWSKVKQRPFRTSLSSQITQYIKDKPGTDVNVDTIFGKALSQILSSDNENNSLLSNLLTDSSHPMIEVTKDISSPADSIVVVGAKNFDYQKNVLDKKISISNQDHESLMAFEYDLSKALVQAGKGGTIISDAVDNTDFLTTLRSKEKLSTVDSVGTIIGSSSLPLALSNSIKGVKGHYGVGEAADAVLPPKPKK